MPTAVRTATMGTAATAMESTTTVRAATTVVATPMGNAVAVEVAATIVSTTAVVAATIAAEPAASISPVIAIPVAWAIAIAVSWATVAINRASVIAALSMVAMTVVTPSVVAVTVAPTLIPGPGTDEYAADKVIRTVVAIRCASVGRISIIAIRADGGSSDAYGNWTYTEANGNLRLRVSGSQQ